MPPTTAISSLLAHTPTPLIIDGALATELESRGLSLTTSLWSALALRTHPSLIRDVHTAYYLAGADIAITASYQATSAGFAAAGIPEPEALELIRLSVRLAREGRAEALAQMKAEGRGERGLLVAGSVGPYGAFLADGSEYTGRYALGEGEMRAFHRGRMGALVEAGVDCLALETMPSVDEVRTLLGMLEEEKDFVGTEVWVSFTVRRDQAGGICICDGTPLREAVRVVEDCGRVVAVGVNCVEQGIVEEALREMAMATGLPLLCYPNSGEVWDAGAKCWRGDRREGSGLGKAVRGWVEAGARMVGLCCRSGPEDIRVVAKYARQ